MANTSSTERSRGTGAQFARKCPSSSEILNNELQQIEDSRLLRLGPEAPNTAPRESLIGLAFSGGGIRSATFNLGILQALAQRRLLRNLDYISTVSGGGYIGSWLMGWMHHQQIGIGELERRLASPPDPPEEAADRPELHFLRNYSNYLTPRKGLLGADLWAFLASYIRNMLLNQTILVLGLLSLLLVPRSIGYFFHALESLEEWIRSRWWQQWMQAEEFSLVLGLLLGFVAIFRIGKNLITLEPGKEEASRKYSEPGAVHLYIVAPLFLSSALLTYSLSHLLMLPSFADHPGKAAASLGMLLYGGLWGLALVFRGSDHGITERVSCQGGPPIWLIALTAALAGMFAGYLFLPYAHVLIAGGVSGSRTFSSWQSLTFGTPALVGVMLAAGVLHIGLMGRGLSDGYREWFARIGGWLVIYSFVWLALFCIALYMPYWLHLLWGWGQKTTYAGAGAWILSTAYGVFFAKSGSTGSGVLSPDAPLRKKLPHYAARVTPYVFILGLLSALSLLAARISVSLAAWAANSEGAGNTVPDSIFAAPSDWHFTFWIPAVCAALLLGAVVLSWRVDINQFSAHKLYRNRLVRCYLGASVRQRDAQPFTGFSSEDDFPLAALAIPPGSTRPENGRPYPIFNTSLNVVHGQELAMQTRKARAFACTPSYCGFTRQQIGGRHLEAAYADTSRLGTSRLESPSYHQGLTIGTAMAISGAAASPNMGFYSSAPLAFLMTVFDVRLGWWMGNPCRDEWEKGSPQVGFQWLLNELVGSTTDESKYVYLSDGGHFENLGVYELVRRRCKLIIVGDGSCDSEYACGDLHNAMERCRTDFGVEITVDVSGLLPTGSPRRGTAHYALGRIHYRPGSPNHDGLMIYLKPSLLPGDPADVLGYSATNKNFPHDSTANQFFDEPLFENYRAIGEATGKAARDTIAEAMNKVLRGESPFPPEPNPLASC